MTFSSHGAPGLASDTVVDDFRDDELTPYLVDDDDKDWDFPVVPVGSHIDAHANLRRDLDTIRELCGSANDSIPEDTSGVLAWRDRT